MPIAIQLVTSAETAPLRQKVLRPHQTVDDLVRAEGDEHAVHFAAMDGGEMVGTASVRPEAAAWARDRRGS